MTWFCVCLFCLHPPNTKKKSKDEKVIVDRSTKGKVGHKNKQISGHHTNGSANNNVFNELLLCAAQSRHQANGVIFDKTSSIDVVADIKFVKVAIAMPLGRKLLQFCCFHLIIDYALFNQRN